MIENDQLSLPRINKKKVKTGCRTCKVRHVKCDEGRPACRRCVSTGRKCDGYGIWGGGGTVCHNTGQSRTVALPKSNNPGSLERDISTHFSKMSAQQVSCFSWFRHRTYAKLPLPYTTPFWHTLVLQACVAEPAILHAALALGSAHQKETLRSDEHEGPLAVLGAQQQFMLREYSQAIRGLQPHFSNQDKRSVHVALITCALFTFFENILGRYVAAKAHLHCGLRLLAETHAPVGQSEDGHAVTTHHRGYVDDWIIEVFMRLHIQAALLGQGLASLYSRLPVFPLGPIPVAFQSTQQAGNHLDRLLLDILHFAEQCCSNDKITNSVPPAQMLSCKQILQGELDLWLAAYHSTILEAFPPIERFYMNMPRAYHTMAIIILNACPWPACETVFDLFTAEFLVLIKQLVEIWKAHVARPVWRIDSQIPPESPLNMSHSVGDKGWLPLLYFVAVKCRVHRIRHQACRLLAKTVHKEGTWDASLTVALAREIIRIEEGDFYQEFSGHGDFNVTDMPTEQDLSLPILPDSHRLYNIQVQLPENAGGVLTLEYDTNQNDAKGFERRKRWYDLQTRCWADVMSR